MPGVIAALGRTYEVRDDLRRLGARWDRDRKVWVVAKAGMAREPMHAERPRYDAVRRAIEEGRLPGVRLEWLR